MVWTAALALRLYFFMGFGATTGNVWYVGNAHRLLTG